MDEVNSKRHEKVGKHFSPVNEASRTHPRHLVTSLRNGKLREFDGKA
jgi:hypothetical protein